MRSQAVRALSRHVFTILDREPLKGACFSFVIAQRVSLTCLTVCFLAFTLSLATPLASLPASCSTVLTAPHSLSLPPRTRHPLLRERFYEVFRPSLYEIIISKGSVFVDKLARLHSNTRNFTISNKFIYSFFLELAMERRQSSSLPEVECVERLVELLADPGDYVLVTKTDKAEPIYVRRTYGSTWTRQRQLGEWKTAENRDCLSAAGYVSYEWHDATKMALKRQLLVAEERIEELETELQKAYMRLTDRSDYERLSQMCLQALSRKPTAQADEYNHLPGLQLIGDLSNELEGFAALDRQATFDDNRSIHTINTSYSRRSEAGTEQQQLDRVECCTSYSLPEPTEEKPMAFTNLAPRKVAHGRWAPAVFSSCTRGVTINDCYILERAITSKYRSARAYLEVTHQWYPDALPDFPTIVDGRQNQSLNDMELVGAAIRIWNEIKQANTNSRIGADVQETMKRNDRWLRLTKAVEECRRRGMDTISRFIPLYQCRPTFLALERFCKIAQLSPGNVWRYLSLSMNELGGGTKEAWDFVLGRIEPLLRIAASPGDEEVAEAIRHAMSL